MWLPNFRAEIERLIQRSEQSVGDSLGSSIPSLPVESDAPIASDSNEQSTSPDESFSAKISQGGILMFLGLCSLVVAAID